jgi:hypothetical protein
MFKFIAIVICVLLAHTLTYNDEVEQAARTCANAVYAYDNPLQCGK